MEEGEEETGEQQLAPSSRSAPASAAGGSAGASLASQPGQLIALCTAAGELLDALQAQGGVDPSLVAAYRGAFTALPGHEWRQAGIATLRAFVDTGDWQAAAAWLGHQST